MSEGSETKALRDATRTRERILAAARREFTRAGFSGAKVRAIAAAAGVSPNLITRYFGGKHGLLVAATEVHLKLGELLNGPRQTLGERLARGIVGRWTALEGEDPLLALFRAAGERPEARETLASFLDRQSLEPLQDQLTAYGIDPAQAAACAATIDIFVLGVTARHRMLRDDLPDPPALERWLASSIQALVDAA